MSNQAQIAEDEAFARSLQEAEVNQARGNLFGEDELDHRFEEMLRRISDSPMSRNAPDHPFQGLRGFSRPYPGRHFVENANEANNPRRARSQGQYQLHSSDPNGAQTVQSHSADGQTTTYIRTGGAPRGHSFEYEGFIGDIPGFGHVHAHHRNGDLPGEHGDMFSVMDLLRGAMFGDTQHGSRGNVHDLLRTVVEGMQERLENPTTYEEWIDLAERMGSVNRGATDEEISRLPTEKFKPRRSRRRGASSSSAPPSESKKEEADKCAICLVDYEEGDEVKRLPCTHMFHSECVGRWLKVNRTCPCCKESIRPETRSS